MKAKLLTALIVAGTALGSQFAHAAPDGTITFKGQVTDTTCTITTGTAGSFTVTMPTVSKANLAANDQVAGTTGFQIALTGCSPATGNVHSYFEAGANLNPATGRLVNTDLVPSGGAANVEVGLLNPSDGSTITVGAPDSTQNSKSFPIQANGTALLQYAAQYHATGGAAAAGTVTSTVTYTLAYQ